MGGQQFKQAYANLVLEYCGGVAGLAGGGCAGNAVAVTPQPFFEAALKNSPTKYCNGFTSCTAAVVANEGLPTTGCTAGVPVSKGGCGTGNLANAQVFSIWSDLDNGGFNFPATMLNTPIPTSPFGASGQTSSGVQVDASTGWGNYNGGFASLKMADWRGVTMQSNLTWSKALGTGSIYQAVSAFSAEDSFNLDQGYGRQSFDRKITYNTFVIYQPPFFKGQQGPLGRLLGGWTFASVFTAGSGTPDQFGTTFCCGQEFGGTDNINFGTIEDAVPITPVTHEHAYYNSPSNALPVNAFKNGVAEAANWRNPILGLDTRDCGNGCLSGLPYWNMDFSIKKNIRIAETVSFELQGVFANVLNHMQWLDSFGCLCNTGGFGALGGEASPRNIQIAGRVRF